MAIPARRLIIGAILAGTLPLHVGAQPQRATNAVRATRVPRTADGHPDLQGVWANATITPLERPKDLGDKEFFTNEEAAAFEKNIVQYYRTVLGELEDRTTGELNECYVPAGQKVVPNRRTSLIVDPRNGRLPSLTSDAQRRVDLRRQRQEEHSADGPEDLPARERCLTWGAGPPLIPVPFNSNLQIVQTRTHVTILTEMIHDARIIPLDGRPHLPPTIRRWTGDSRGRWEGDTLVVDTTNFTDKAAFNTPFGVWDEALHVIERFRRRDRNTLLYEFTVDDPTTYTQRWSAAFPMTRSDEQIFEYACHEANYSMTNILRGGRAEERRR